MAKTPKWVMQHYTCQKCKKIFFAHEVSGLDGLAICHECLTVAINTAKGERTE